MIFILLVEGFTFSYDTTTVVAINNSTFDGDGLAPLSASGCYYRGIWIESSDGISEFNQFLFNNVNISNYAFGLHLNTSGEKALIELSSVNVHDNDYGIVIYNDTEDIVVHVNRSISNSSSTVDLSSVTFRNNVNALTVNRVDNVIISFATFIDNIQPSSLSNINTVSVSSATFTNHRFDALLVDNASTIILSSATFMFSHASFTLTSGTVNVSFVTFIRSGLYIYVELDNFSGSSSFVISNSYFSYVYQYLSELIGILIRNRGECARTNIVFTNVTFYKASWIASYVLYIDTENTIPSIMFKDVNFMSNHAGASTLFINTNQNMQCESYHQNMSIQLTNCTFDENFVPEYAVYIAINVKADSYNNLGIVTVELSDCKFDHNSGGKSIVYVYFPPFVYPGSMILDNTTFINNKGTALHLVIAELKFKRDSLFVNNSASDGAAVYMERVDAISFNDNAIVQFKNNSAKLKGGATYINLVGKVFDIDQYCNVFNSISNTSNVSFTNNSAGVAGNSIYFNIPESCQIITNVNDKSSLLYYLNMFKYSEPLFTKSSPVITSAYNIELYPPAIAIHNSDNEYLIQESKMLGEPIEIIASVFDYFNNIAEPVTFSINCKLCGSTYLLSTHLISVHNQSIYALKILPTVAEDVVNNTDIIITFLSALYPVYRQINASLSIELSSCRAGYLFNNTQRPCVCYPHHDIVHCKEDYVEIKIGYWIGYLTEQHYTSSICPNNYCSSEHTETSPGFYSLRGKSDDQCSSHRTGVACGKCKSGYTLAYDSPDCINTDKCCVGMTILVIVLTILYWITIVAVVFGLMYFQFQISSGYAYGIIYYYSIVDILLVNDVTEEVFHLVSVLSSFAKLNPQLFGQLCFVEGLSGIDQQFIHYSHALAVSLILLIIVLVARYSARLTRFVSPCVIRVICLLLLLSYTSLASTSLQLLRPLTFNDVDEVRTYSSPDIKYFTGRHLVYGIVAILCEVIIVIGLPLFLLLEPFLRRRVNLVRIKPLLDQFQGCYKDKYRWFAAYYLICRQVIILIVYVGNGNYYYMLYGLQTACVINAMIHGVVQPYKNDLLNGLDEVILVILILVANLNLFSLSSFIPTNYFSVILVILPLLLICFIAIRKSISHFFIRKKRELQLYNPVGTHEGNDRNNERR